MKLRPSCHGVHPHGSALLPLVAAMLILLLCGSALAEVFATQRVQSVLRVESVRAVWIAEAGLWHAAHEKSAITTAVSFAGGSYTVDKSGNDYSANGDYGQGFWNATRTMFSTTSPLDEVASAATAEHKSNNKFELDLVSISSTDVVIESFELSANVSTYDAKKLKLDHKSIWQEEEDTPLPTGITLLNQGDTGKRTVEAWDDPTLEYQSHSQPTGEISYTLVLHFTNGASSTISFAISWSDDDDGDDGDDNDEENDDD